MQLKSVETQINKPHYSETLGKKPVSPLGLQAPYKGTLLQPLTVHKGDRYPRRKPFKAYVKLFYLTDSLLMNLIWRDVL